MSTSYSVTCICLSHVIITCIPRHGNSSSSIRFSLSVKSDTCSKVSTPADLGVGEDQTTRRSRIAGIQSTRVDSHSTMSSRCNWRDLLASACRLLPLSTRKLSNVPSRNSQAQQVIWNAERPLHATQSPRLHALRCRSHALFIYLL